jgi:hypothetical protein
VHEFIYDESPFAYNVATATVLPLQGTWNGIIFLIANWRVLRETVGDLITPKKEEVVEFEQRRAKPARQGRSVYSMWRDAEPADTAVDRPIGLGIAWRPKEAKGRRDSWDFLDIGVDHHDNSQQCPGGMI